MTSRITPVLFGNAKFTVYAPGAVRLEFNRHKAFPATPSILCGPRLPKPIKADVAIKGKTITVTTPVLTLSYTDDGKEFNRDNLSIRHPFERQRGTWRPGDADAPLVELVRSLDIWPNWERFGREEHAGLLDKNGRRLIVDDAQVYRTRDGNWVEATPKDRRGQDWWFFGYGWDYAAALREFTHVFGQIPLVPRWVFGYWYSRWFEYTADDILAIARKYRAARLPMDVMVIDTEWREEGWNGYNWHPTLFRNHARMMKELKAMGLIVPFNDHPGYDNSDSLPSTDKALPAYRRRMGEAPWQGTWACNWSSRASTEAWKNLALAAPFKDGMDFWWVDGWATTCFPRVKPQLWINEHYFDVAEKATGKRGLVLSRWGGWGSHRYPVQFSGDTCSTWDTLRHQIAFTADSCGAGAVYWSHDIGGFHDKVIADDLYIRWIQFGAFSPVFRTHSAFGTREPFEYSKTAQKVFRAVVAQRYAMAPYYYNAAREAHDTGMPVCRPMYVQYPNLRATYANRLQYLVGRDVLVVPAFTPGARPTRQWWVPDGTWVRPETGDVMRGHGMRSLAIPLGQIPVFYRLGSIIPHELPALCTRQQKRDTLWLDVYPSPDVDAVLDLYEDDNETRAFEDGMWCRTKVTCKVQPDGIVVSIGAPRGKFAPQVVKRTMVVNIWLGDAEGVNQVLIDGTPAPKKAWKLSSEYAGGACAGEATFLRVTCPAGTRAVAARPAV